jgi:sugar/nucleoside kinase (ribokinase family)
MCAFNYLRNPQLAIIMKNSDEKTFDVVALGSCTLDLIFAIDDILRLDMIDRDNIEKKYVAIEYSSKLNVKSLSSHPGGSAANIACDLAAIGMKTAYIGGIGGDAAGKLCLEDMHKFGTDVSHVKIFPEEATAHSVILITPMGKDRSIMAYKGANDLISKKDIDDKLLQETRCFAWTSLTSDSSIGAIQHCINVTRAYKGLIAGAPSISIIKKRHEDATKLLKQCDITSMNDEEITNLTKKKDIFEGIQMLFDWGLSYVNVTFGKEGQWLAGKKEHKVVKTKPPKVVVNDTTGAGDATMSGIIYGVLKGMPMDQMARIAASLSAMEIEGPGVRVGLPGTIDDLDHFMDEHPMEQDTIDFPL